MLMKRKDTLTLDPNIENQLLEQFDIQPDRVQHYLDHLELLPTFMDLRVDYAFKYILGHKRILIKLINDILPVQVDDIEYLSNEIPVMSIKEKRATFDVICTARGSGEKFIAEMQYLPDADMDDRLLFYGCSLVHNQIERGDDSYLLRPVYVLCIANYFRKHNSPVATGQFFFSYQYREVSNPRDCLTNNLQFFFLELPRLQKVWDSLETNLERWCYLFGNLNSFVETPRNQAGFEDLFSIAQTGELNEKGIGKYLTSMITEYDRKVIGDFFFHEGKAEAVKTTAKKLKELGVDVPIISQATGLTESEIEAL